jgi:hypothetical protein
MVDMGTRRVAPIMVVPLALAIFLAVGCASQDVTPKQTAKQATPERTAGHANETPRQTGTLLNTGHTTGDPVVVAAGDIASCASKGDEVTANLLARIDGTVVTLGDNASNTGRLPISASATTRAGESTRRAPSPPPATTITL